MMDQDEVRGDGPQALGPERESGASAWQKCKDAARIVAITPVLGMIGMLMLAGWMFSQLEEVLWCASSTKK